jgi:NhaP-type Na+/H+ or K+/H+ antiporter
MALRVGSGQADQLARGRAELQLVLLRLLLPFGVYLLAEHLAVSGILAVVAAGVTVDLTDLRPSGNLAGRMQGRDQRPGIGSLANHACR